MYMGESVGLNLICVVGHLMFEKSANKPALFVPPKVSVLLRKY